MHRYFLPSFVAVCACLLSPALFAQTNQQLTIKPWSEGAFGETNDRLFFQFKSEVQNENAHASVFWWDSTGRFRFDKEDDAAPAIGYRWLTMSFDTDSHLLPDHLDEISLATGIHLKQTKDEDLAVVAGGGYSGNNPFADTNGIFGIGHVTYRRKLNEHDSLILSLDYFGNSSFLPDVPLPGFAFEHREPRLGFAFGYPDSWVHWQIAPQLDFDASYSVPFSADATLEYHFTSTLSVFLGVSNFFNGFAQDEEPITDRLFYQMSRAGGGIHYRNPSLFNKFYVDMSLIAGYAFSQNFSHGFDARDLDTFTSISDEPYIGLVIVGRM